MTDFYTLFLVLAEYHLKMPFSSDVREKLNIQLVDFGTRVTSFQKAVKDDTAINEKDLNIRNYSSGIRSSTDLGSRKLRFESLSNIIREIIEK